jgi:hypothetical protein
MRLILRTSPTLALFFGDEFIDGLAETSGKPFIRKLVENNNQRSYLHKQNEGNKVRLHCHFRFDELFPAEILKALNPKYGHQLSKILRTNSAFPASDERISWQVELRKGR